MKDLKSYIESGLIQYAAATLPASHGAFDKEVLRRIDEAKSDLSGKINKKQVSLILGAGISVPYNIPSWTSLLDNIFIEQENLLKTAGYIETNIFKRVRGFDPLISARYLRKTASGSFESALRKLLYSNLNTSSTSNLINSIARIISEKGIPYIDTIITYNYDDILETELKKNKIDSKTIINNLEDYNPRLVNVYHVHGYLPRKGQIPKSMNLVLSENDYFTQYKQPYNWSDLIQIETFRSKTCIFIGLSLTDPNIRRLLDFAILTPKFKGHFHYILKKKYTDEEIKFAINTYLEEFKTTLKLNSKDIKVIESKQTVHKIKQLLFKFDEVDLEAYGIKCLWFDDFNDWSNFFDKITI